MTNFITVDQNQGEYRNIQQALDVCSQNTVIKVEQGLYYENIVIRKDNITIQSADEDQDVILVSQKGPIIKLDLLPISKCKIIGIKLCYIGYNQEELKIEDMFSNFHIQIQKELQNEEKSEIQQFFKDDNIFDENLDCGILIKSGILSIEKTLITLNFLEKNHKSQIIGIFQNQGSILNMNQCDIKGSKNHNTIGILIKFAQANILNSVIQNHQNTGIYIDGYPQNDITINNNKIKKNGNGIICSGALFSPKILSNQIEFNDYSGIQVNISCKPKIFNNEIVQNNIGIKAISCQAFIKRNKISKNELNGIQTITVHNYRLDCQITKNEISCNLLNGIICQGKNNFTLIQSNAFIGLNKQAGIVAEDQASITIIDNMICRNYTQGILLVETTCSKIEKNNINNNIEANIALGGQNSVDTFIVENKIHSGSKEGIFMIECGQCWILRNQIYKNFDGIVSANSVPLIDQNKIYKNLGQGLIVLNNSQPKITNNKIIDNDGIGLFIRDVSFGTMQQNNILNNEIDCVIEKYSNKIQDFTMNNQIQGDKRYPSKNFCNIF